MGLKSIIYFSFFILSNKYTAAQTINRIAGTVGVSGYAGDGGAALNARFNHPAGIAVDNLKNIYVFDQLNAVIRKINPQGIISTFAGNGTVGYSGDGGQATSAQLNNKYSGNPAIDNAGNIYFADAGNQVIRKINTQGIIITIAGNGTAGFSGDGGLAINAKLNDPRDITIDNNGNIFVCDHANARIRKINTSGIITTFAGNGIFGYSGDGGPATMAQISPQGVTLDNSGNLLFCDYNAQRIRRVNTSGVISTIAGTGVAGYSGDGGAALLARLNFPHDVHVDAAGNIYISDYDNFVIRKINAVGIISTVVGNGTSGYSGDGGSAIAAQITHTLHVWVDNDGSIYITDFWDNHVIRKIDNCVTTVASAVSITSNINSFCEGTNVIFSATSVNGGSNPAYQWKVNGVNNSNTGGTFSTSTLKDGDVITCEMQSSINCAPSVLSNSIAVKVLAIPAVNAGADLLINPGQSVQINATVGGIITSYQWLPVTGLNNPAALNPVAKPATTTKYRLTVTASNGCKNSDDMTVTVYKKLMMPSAFTPNNDGLNDLFKIPEGTSLQLDNFSVYNRYGTIVFKTNNINAGWDGKYKGALSGTEAYIYMITGNSPVGKVFEKGTVLIIK